MSQNITYRLPMSIVTAQLTINAGRTVVAKDVVDVSYDPSLNTARITLAPIGNSFNKITEYFVFSRTQIVNFYNNYAGTSISASNITLIRIDSDPSFVELVPLQT